MNKTEWPERAKQLGARAFVTLQLLLPTNLLSTLMFHVARIQTPWFKNAFIRIFMRVFRISLDEAEISDPARFPDFNSFFTRGLRPGARSIDSNPASLVSPVDGTISQIGRIEAGRILQAKGHDYSPLELLNDPDLAAPFENGSFATIYLAPYDYHRIHMPADGVLRAWNYVPGRIFSVNAATVREMPRVFVRNERLSAVFQTPFGPVALVMVGALFVGSLETVWAGRVTPPHGQTAGTYVPSSPVRLGRGVEMGRFNMGSTVILLTGPGVLNWDPHLKPLDHVRVGQVLGSRARTR